MSHLRICQCFLLAALCSLPPRAVAFLKHLGFHADGFAVMEGHTAIWGGTEPHRAVFEAGYGLQVERSLTARG